MSTFIKVVESVCVGIGKILELLFIRLFLWIPACYLMITVIASIIYGFSLEEYAQLIVIALVFCCVLALLFAAKRSVNDRFKDDKTQKSMRRKMSDHKDIPQEIDQQPYGSRDNRVRLFATNITKKNQDSTQAPTAQPSSLGWETIVTQPSNDQPLSPPPPPQHTSLQNQQAEPPKWPRYLRTRRDPSIVLVEFEDRLDVYRRTINNNLEYINTEYKSH